MLALPLLFVLLSVSPRSPRAELAAAPAQSAPAPASPAAAAEQGARSAWTFTAAGQLLGYHEAHDRGRELLGAQSVRHLSGSVRLKLQPGSPTELRALSELWTDERGRPLKFTQRALVGEQYSSVELVFAGASVEARIVQGKSKRSLTLPVEPGALLLANNFISHLEFALAAVDPAQPNTLEMFSANTLRPFRYTLTPAGSFAAEGRPEAGRVFSDSLGETLRVLDGRILEVEVAAAQLSIRRTDERFEPFAIEAPAPESRPGDFASEPVRIAREAGWIAGEITKPAQAAGRLPAVLFVSGSGTQDRDGISSGIELGTREILDRLTRDGLLVLRVDDRGAGESSPAPADQSFLDLVGDARACLEFLRARADVDPQRIAVIGHSEGGETAPLLALESPPLAAIALMAAPGRSLLEVVRDQNRLALEKAGVRGAELEQQLANATELLKRLSSDAPVAPEELPEEQRGLLANRAWLRTHAAHDPIATLEKVRCPVLVLQGELDFQVSLERDARALEDALARAGNPDHELAVFAGLDHLFKRVPGAQSELSDYFLQRPVAPEFLDKLSSWLCARLGVAKH